MSINQQLECILEHVVACIDEEDLKSKLKENRPLRIKFGADPSRPDLHLGHAIALQKLRVFQDLGHHVIFIIGDFTARIGDPSGRNITRPILSTEEIRQNAQTYKDQISHILDLNKLEIRYNYDWLSQFSFEDVLQWSGRLTVNQMLQRDDFKTRFERQSPIGLHELMYPLMQAYDSIELQADVEIGGTDQMFNMMLGRHLQKSVGQPPQVILLMPLLEGLDGQQKMSKSYNNGIYLQDTPKDFFGKIMSLSDPLFEKYAHLFYPASLRQELTQQLKCGRNPRDAKLDFGVWMLEQILRLSPEDAQTIRDQFIAQFSRMEIPTDIPTHTVSSSAVFLSEILPKYGLASSKSEVKRLLTQQAIRVNGNIIVHDQFHVKHDVVIKIGKRRFLKLIKENSHS